MINLHTFYQAEKRQGRMLFFVMMTVLIFALFSTIFFSPLTTLALLLTLTLFGITIFRPLLGLTFLCLLIPFEPFLLKWIGDDLYVYARVFSEALVYLLFGVSVVRAFVRGEKLMPTPITFPFFLFLIVLLASSIVNLVDPVIALVGIRQLIRFVLLFFAVVLLKPSSAFMRSLTVLLFLVVSLQSAIGMSQAFVGESLDTFLLPSESRSYGEFVLTEGTLQFWDPGSRVFGTLGRYDRLGTFLAFFLLIGLAFLYEKRDRFHRRELFALFAFGLPALLLTFSRSSWFGFLLGFLFLALWVKRDKRVLIGTALAASALALYLAYSGIVVSRLVDVPGQTLPERFFEAFSYERWRGEYYGLGRLFWIVQTLTVVLPASPLFGWGPGQYGGGASTLFHNTRVFDELGLPYGVYGTEGYIDNNWFSILGETGIVGFVFFLWMYLALFRYALSVGRASHDSLTRAISFGFAGAMIAVALNAFLATFFEIRSLAVYLWIYGGFVVVLGHEEKKERLK